MKVKFEVVCPMSDDNEKFSYYPMELDYRLVKEVTLAPTGGCLVVMITGQTIHANQPHYVVDGKLQRCRATHSHTVEVTPNES